MNDDELKLIEKLRRIEALFARPGTDGERDAASRARDRILEKLRESVPHVSQPEEPVVEYRFSLADPWSRRLLLAILKHHGIATYRRPGQRRNTIRARVARSYVDDVVWPQFCGFERELREYFDQCTARIIEQALTASTRERASASTGRKRA